MTNYSRVPDRSRPAHVKWVIVDALRTGQYGSAAGLVKNPAVAEALKYQPVMYCPTPVTGAEICLNVLKLEDAVKQTDEGLKVTDAGLARWLRGARTQVLEE